MYSMNAECILSKRSFNYRRPLSETAIHVSTVITYNCEKLTLQCRLRILIVLSHCTVRHKANRNVICNQTVVFGKP